MKKEITFRMVSYTDPAGKYAQGAPNSGNEDNFFVDDDLGNGAPSHCSPDKVVELSDCGMLMSVADGMGGMNAGEVASEIAIATVTEYFGPGCITPKLAQDPQKRRKYLEDLIREADRRIKKQASQNPDQEGMGSTIILAWLVGDVLTVSWCGDSRAYRFNPASGLEPLSEDHSYVQDLVRQGRLRYELTFDHPQGNIVTRSLGDPGKEAKPDTREFRVCNGDVILLCSDGLSGVLRDRKTYDVDGQLLPGDNIEDIIAAHTSSMLECREALWEAAERADWYDNVTAILCQIIDGAGTAAPVTRPKACLGPIKVAQPVGYSSGGATPAFAGGESGQQQVCPPQPSHKWRNRFLMIIGALLCILIGVVVGLWSTGYFDQRDKGLDDRCRQLKEKSIGLRHQAKDKNDIVDFLMGRETALDRVKSADEVEAIACQIDSIERVLNRDIDGDQELEAWKNEMKERIEGFQQDGDPHIRNEAKRLGEDIDAVSSLDDPRKAEIEGKVEGLEREKKSHRQSRPSPVVERNPEAPAPAEASVGSINPPRLIGTVGDSTHTDVSEGAVGELSGAQGRTDINPAQGNTSTQPEAPQEEPSETPLN